MLAYDKLIENYGEKRAEKIMKIFCKISIEETSKKDKLELEKWKEIIKETKVELDKLENKAKYLEELTKKKKDITKKIEEIDKIINKKQLPMRKKKKTVYKVLTKEELSTFFNCVDDYKFKTIFMIAYGSGLRIGEIVNLHISDIDSKKMRIFVREGKGNKERYTILSKTSLEMLRTYWSKYRKPVKSDKIFLTELDEPMTVGVIRDRFIRYRRKAGLNEKVTMHTLRHCYATNLIENGATLIQVKELMGHSNIRSTMEYVHVANIDLGLESPLDVFLRGEEDGENKRNIK